MEKQKSENKEKTPRILVVGGGAAGMMAALFAVGEGHSVHLFEQNEKLGKKLFITGKGRCNFTNACSREEMLANVISNPRFLYSSIQRWDSDDSQRFFTRLGVPVKVERGNRAFPASDHSSDIIRALEKALRDSGVVIHLRSKVAGICLEEDPASAAPGKRAVGVRLYNVFDSDLSMTGALMALAALLHLVFNFLLHMSGQSLEVDAGIGLVTIFYFWHLKRRLLDHPSYMKRDNLKVE